MKPLLSLVSSKVPKLLYNVIIIFPKNFAAQLEKTTGVTLPRFHTL